MDMKSKARLLGVPETAEWTKEMEAYRIVLERETNHPLPNEMLLSYIGSLTEKDKLAIALTLEFPFARRELRKWPEMLFVKMLRTSMQQAPKNIAVKRRLLLSILQLLPDELDPDIPANELLQNEENYIAAHGVWAFYWTFYFNSGKFANETLWHKEMQRIEERLKVGGQEQPIKELHPSHREAADEAGSGDKSEKKLKLLEGLYRKELTARQRMEHELAQKDKLLRMKSKELAQLEDELDRLRDEAEQTAGRAEQQEKAQREREQKWKQEQAGWLEERQSFMEHMRSLNVQQSRMERALESQKKELQSLENEKALLRDELAQARKSPRSESSRDDLTHKLISRLEQEVAELGAAVADRSGQGSSADTRARLRKALDLLDALDRYQETAEWDSAAARSDEASPTDHEREFDAPSVAQQGPLPDNPAPLYGTFYRRDHGGYIKLENGDAFNITESLVQQHELQHEAELLCTPRQLPGKPLHYDLQLLFQGDDAYSPVRQYDGFVEMGDGPLYFCVDMNDSNNRFQIHHKDVEIQKPAHGDPCTFNVAEGSFIARLTKLYRQQGSAAIVEDARPRSLMPVQAESISSIKRGKEKKELSKEKQKPFLQNCMITIVGGLRKWFENVVRESGAELAHDNGNHPERIMADLRRSQALFLLITSTSHRATWEGIDVAKTNGIPHFIIQGSKSNLRSLLWENRDLISGSNR